MAKVLSSKLLLGPSAPFRWHCVFTRSSRWAALLSIDTYRCGSVGPSRSAWERESGEGVARETAAVLEGASEGAFAAPARKFARSPKFGNRARGGPRAVAPGPYTPPTSPAPRGSTGNGVGRATRVHSPPAVSAQKAQVAPEEWLSSGEGWRSSATSRVAVAAIGGVIRWPGQTD